MLYLLWEFLFPRLLISVTVEKNRLTIAAKKGYDIIY